MRWLLFALCLLAAVGCCLAAEVATIDDFSYADVTAARAAWVGAQGLADGGTDAA